MRDYGKVAPQFWTGQTGKALKAAGPETVIVAMYLMTSPHANMIGLYYLPKLYIAHETGLSMEGASKGLARAIEAGFCSYDDASEHVFVHAMARFQIADQLSANDKRCKGVENELSKCPDSALVLGFRRIYGDAFHLEIEGRTQAPSKPLRSQEQEQEQEQDKEIPPADAAGSSPADPKPKPKRPPTITDWLASLGDADAIPADDPVYAYAEKAGIPDDFLLLSWSEFKSAYTASGKRQKDFPATYRNAVKGNWYKLWWISPEGDYRLTTAGEQAKRAQA